jgi:predicted nucleic acid-binding Zn finger protein
MRDASMKKTHEADMLEDICKIVRAEGKISETHVSRLSETFGQRGNKALEALNEGRIKKYIFQPSGRVVWIVVGKNRDYLVMPEIDYCSCYDFYFQFDSGHVCYHIIAQKLAEAIDMFDKFEDDDKLFNILIQEWKAPDQRKPKKTSPAEGEDYKGTA